jgi:hypothetical protein
MELLTKPFAMNALPGAARHGGLAGKRPRN